MRFLAIILTALLPLGAAVPQGSPGATVSAFHGAITAGDRDGALELLDENVVIFESGGAEMSGRIRSES